MILRKSEIEGSIPAVMERLTKSLFNEKAVGFDPSRGVLPFNASRSFWFSRSASSSCCSIRFVRVCTRSLTQNCSAC